MNKKILICTLAAMGFASAKINVGVVLQGGFMKPKTKFFGTDNFTANGQSFTNNISKSMNAFGGGLLLGYEADCDKPIKTLFEVDVQLFNKKMNSGVLNSKNSTGALGSNLDAESFTFKKRLEVGFTPSFIYAMNAKIDAIFGLRFNMSHYKFDITSGVANLIVPSESFWMMGIEPNVGGRFKVNEKVSARFSVGYNFAQKYTKTGYVTTNAVATGTQANVSFQPSGVNIRAAVTYSFS